MKLHTTNLTALKASPQYQKLLAVHPHLVDSITEEPVPVLPDWDCPHLGLPAGTKYNANFNTIVFLAPIELVRVRQVYNPTRACWMYLPDRPAGDEYGGRLSEDGRSILLNDPDLSSKCTPDDALAGFYVTRIKARDSARLLNGSNYGDMPASYTAPVATFDLKQLDDLATYDGSFAMSETEARALPEDPAPTILFHLISTMLDDDAGAAPAPTDEVVALRQQVAKLTDQVTRAKAILNE